MEISLRGHHLLCLLGFRGKGYSLQFTGNMARIYEALRRDSSTHITLVEGEDDICSAFPSDAECHCADDSVRLRDKAVLRRLLLQAGDRISWEGILNRTRESVRAHDVRAWCFTCPWRPLGYCEEGVSRLKRGGSLPPLPDRNEEAP